MLKLSWFPLGLAVQVFLHLPHIGTAGDFFASTPAQLEQAVRSAVPGDRITIRNGHYSSWTITLGCSGSENSPIIIQGESDDGVIFTGACAINITGRFLQLKDLEFVNFTANGKSTIAFDGSSGCRVTNIRFSHGQGDRPVVQFQAGANHNVLEHCTFTDIAGRSVHLQVNNAVYEKGIPENNVIRNNLFKDIPPLHDNGRETVKLGQNQPEFGHIKTHALVEGNTFLRCDGEAEIISNKSSNNTFRNNTLIDSMGELVMRGGSNCLIEGNRMVNCSGGIRLSGTGHTVRDNVIITPAGTGIRLLYGMTTDQGGHYQAVRDCVISGNTIIHPGTMGILIGDGRNKDWGDKGVQKLAPEDNQFVDNLIINRENNFIQTVHAPGNVIQNNIMRPE